MARQGVFNRNDNSLHPVDRSVQYYDHSASTTLPYGQVTPIFCELMYPGERLRLNVTNLLRTIPLKTPQITRVKAITRFYAVPPRIMWQGFEEYIDGVKDSRFALEEPSIANFNSIMKQTYAQVRVGGVIKNTFTLSFYGSKNGAVAGITGTTGFANSTDFSVLGLGYSRWRAKTLAVGDTVQTDSFSRGIRVIDGVTQIPEVGDAIGYQFYPHELGDYLNAPTYVACLYSDKTSRYSAFPFCAYQMVYSYGYRNNNVQTRVDDIYEMSDSGISPRRIFAEFPTYYAKYDMYLKDSVSPISEWLYSEEYNGSNAMIDSVKRMYVNPSAIHAFDAVNPSTPVDTIVNAAESSDADDVIATSWECVEHFPLKGGANLVMQAMNFESDGRMTQTPTRISLTRLRYANWQSDRFTEANLWQQRGDEARIPVVGTASFSGVGVDIDGYVPISAVQNANDPYVKTVKTRILENNQVTLNDDNKGIIYGVQNYYNGVMDTTHLTNEASGGAVLVGNSDFDSPLSIFDNDLESYLHIPKFIDNGKTTQQLLGVDKNDVAASLRGSASGLTGAITGSPTLSGLYVSPSSFRFAMQLQKIKEMSARTDGRFKSFLSMFYGTRSRDSRLDRPEFIGGSVQEVNISEIAQTSESTSESPLGTLAGRGFSAKKSYPVEYSAYEHTYIIGLVHLVPDSEYIGGLERTKNTISPFDYALPQFAGLSEQPIYMKELALRPSKFDTTDNSDNNIVFGYEPRYNELRVKHSYATGAFRDYWNTTGSREYYKPWLVTRQFGYEPSMQLVETGETYESDIGTDVTITQYAVKGLTYKVPSLSDAFLSMRDTVDYSNFEVQNPEIMMPFMCDSYFNIRWTRIIPSRGIPRI